MNSKYQHIQHHKITRLSWTVSLINQTEGWAITLAVHRVGLLVRSTLFHDLHLNIDHLLSCVAISVIIICSPAIASIHTPTYMLLLYFSQGNPQMLKQSPDVSDTKYALNIKILLTGSAGLGHLLKKKGSTTYNFPGSLPTLSIHKSIEREMDAYYTWVGSSQSSNFSVCEICHMDSSEEWSPSLSSNRGKTQCFPLLFL